MRHTDTPENQNPNGPRDLGQIACSMPGAARDYAADLAVFLLERTGSVLGHWSGKLTAAEQRQLFGRFLGKGRIVIDGTAETLCNRVKVCFGQDWDDRNQVKWREL